MGPLTFEARDRLVTIVAAEDARRVADELGCSLDTLGRAISGTPVLDVLARQVARLLERRRAASERGES